MTKNMGTTDRLVRARLIAPVLLAIAFLVGFATAPGIIATLLAVGVLATAAVGVCPLYVPFHLHTGHASKASA